MENTVIDLNNKIENKKLEQIEKVLHALTRKVLSLEDEIKMMKKIKIPMKKKRLKKQVLFNIDDIKCSSSTPKDVKENNKDKTKDDMLTCNKCNYKCKK